jgi:hypothetical protein
VALAQFLFAVAQELHEGAVDIAEAEEAEVVGANERPLTRLRMPAPKGAPKNTALSARLKACPDTNPDLPDTNPDLPGPVQDLLAAT